MRLAGWRAGFALIALATSAATSVRSEAPAPPPASHSPASPPATARICDLKNAALQPVAASRRVILVGPVWYDFEHGYFLSDHPACQDRTDNTDLLGIELAPGADIGDFPELLRVSSQAFMRAHVGQRIFCTCAGEVSYADGVARFVLSSARIWTSDR